MPENFTRRGRRIALGVGASALVTMGVLTAGCSTKAKEEPTTPPTPTSASVAPSPTEKRAAPMPPGGPNSFTPTINPAPAPPTCTKVVGNVCVR